MNIEIDGYPFKKYRYVGGKWGFREPSYSAVKRFLVEKYKVCWYCGVECKLYQPIDGVGAKDDQATIEHLIPKTYRNNKGRRKYESVEKVLACYKCNHERNRQFQKTGKLTSI